MISLILANVLLLVAAGIGIEGIRGMIDPQSAAMPGMLALIAAVVSVASKEVLYWYTRAAAKKIDSVSLMAEAWHHRSDAISSVGSFIGIFQSDAGFSRTAAGSLCFDRCAHFQGGNRYLPGDDE